MTRDPQPLPDDERPPLFSSWRRLYIAILLWELITIGVIAALSSWAY
jgi:hypothetical protein